MSNDWPVFLTQDQEKEELLEQYQLLTGETERLVTESKLSAGQVSSYHVELMDKQRSEMELNSKIRRLESEIEQVSGTSLSLFFSLTLSLASESIAILPIYNLLEWVSHLSRRPHRFA